MSTAAPVPVDQPTADRIQTALQEAAAIALQFSAPAAAIIEAGAEVEPVIKGLIGLFSAIFHHHMTKPQPSLTSKA